MAAAAAARATVARSEVCIGNPTGKRILSSDWNNRQVSWDPSLNGFVVNIDELPESTRTVQVRVQTKEDPRGDGKSEDGTWETITLDLSLFPVIDSFRIKREWELSRSILDVVPWIVMTMGQKYQHVFDRYRYHFFQAQEIAKHPQALPISLDPGPSFAALYKADQPEPDARFILMNSVGPDDCTADGMSDNTQSSLKIVRSIPVHKFVIMASSKVLMDFLQSSSVHEFYQMNGDLFEKFVKYLYTKQIQIDSDEEAMELHMLALMYKMDHLRCLTSNRTRLTLLARIHPNTLVSPANLATQMAGLDTVPEIAEVLMRAVDQIDKRYTTLVHYGLYSKTLE